MQAYDSVEPASSEGAEEGGYNGTNCGLRFYVDTDHTTYILACIQLPDVYLVRLIGFLNVCLPLVNSCPLVELQTHKYSHEFLTIPMHFQPIWGNWSMLACLFNQFCLERFRLRWSLMIHANEICWNEILGWPQLRHLTSGPQIMPNNTCRGFVTNFI